MSEASIGVQGLARAVTRRLPGNTDLLSIYAHLSDQGRRPDTMLFETAAGRSILLERAAIRITCRGGEVVLDGLSPGGQSMLTLVRERYAKQIVADKPGRLTLRFDRTEEIDAEARLRAASPFDVLRTILKSLRSDSPEEPMTICLAGILGFDHVELFEELPPYTDDELNFPDFIFWLAESAIIADPGRVPRVVCTAFACDDGELQRAVNSAVERLGALAERAVTAAPFVPEPGSKNDVSIDLDDDEYVDVVVRLKEHVLAGDVYQIVPSRTFSAPCPDPISAFARVRALDKNPYMFFAKADDWALFGASPETSVRITRDDADSILEVKPIAGTRPRGATADEDDRMEADLRLDAKEVAEHMMLVDLARNDVARVSEPGSRHVASLMSIEKYARVMHLVSSVKGKLAARFDAFHALQACLNVGTLSGAPKLRATQLLRRYERTRRGPYGGAIGWLNGEGALDTGVIIRSALVKDGVAYVRAGAGVVQDSDPQAEADETRRKASAILSAIAGEGP